MALAFYFAPNTPMSARRYNECVKRLEKTGAGQPTGRVYHACFGSSENLAVFDVWTSQAAFEAFGKTFMPIMQQIGADPGQPTVMSVHNVIVPPAKKLAAKKSAPKKRATAPKSKARSNAGKKRWLAGTFLNAATIFFPRSYGYGRLMMIDARKALPRQRTPQIAV